MLIWVLQVREAIWKRDFLMEIFRKGSHPVLGSSTDFLAKLVVVEEG